MNGGFRAAFLIGVCMIKVRHKLGGRIELMQQSYADILLKIGTVELVHDAPVQKVVVAPKTVKKSTTPKATGKTNTE